MVLGVITFQPAVVIAGAAMASDGGLRWPGEQWRERRNI